ncbi:GHKL domain-containing protein [bacterium]|nr:GHKL domain-containing protein [bacterium]
MYCNVLLKILILSIWISMTPIQAMMHQYRFKHIDKRHGLTNNQIKCIYKDSRGFLWFGTVSGLNRFNGHSIRTYRHDNNNPRSISDNFIMNITEDHRGKLWIEAMNVMNVYDPITDTFSQNTQKAQKALSIPDTADIRDIIRDHQGNFWYFSSTTIYQYVSKNSRIVAVACDSSAALQSAGSLSAAAENSQGDFWLVCQNGIIEKMDTHTCEITYRNDFLYQKYKTDHLLFQMCIDNDDDLWIANINAGLGVFYFNTKTNKFRHFHTNSRDIKLNTNIITDIVLDDNGAIWIATDHGGINILNKNDFSVQYITHYLEDDNSISHNSITCLYKDNTGILWAGTYKKGVNYYHPDIFKFKLYHHLLSDTHSLPYNDINGFTEDDKGNIWIGTNGGGLVYFDRVKEKFANFVHDQKYSNSISTNTIICLHIDHKKRLWIGTFFGGLNCYDGRKFTRYLSDPSDSKGLPSGNIWSIFEDSERVLWIGTLDQGLFIYNRDKNTFTHFTDKKGNSINSNQINSIMEDKEGNLWFGTTAGINVLNKKTGNLIYYTRNDSNPNSIVSNGVYQIIEDKRGLIWVATRKGLNLFDKEKQTFRLFNEDEGLTEKLILTLIEDNQGNLWMGTPNGLYHLIITPKQGSDSLNFHFKNYNEDDGLQSREFNQFSAYKTRNGELIFGGAEGFNLFSPDEIKTNLRIPDVILTNFQVSGRYIDVHDTLNGRVIINKSIHETNEIVLNHDENMFSFEFAALSYFHPEKNKYAYILEGFNSEWLYSDGNLRKATYTNINPGEYIFKVKASNNDGIWNETGTAVKIIITPPFWMTWWFKTSIMLILVLGLVVVVESRINRIKKQKTQFEFLVQERTKDLLLANQELENQKTSIQKYAQALIQSNEELEAFSYSVSHDLRAPLRSMNGFSQTLLESYAEKLDEQGKHFLQRIHNASQQMGNLIDDLLILSRLSRKDIQFKRFNLSSLVESIVKDFQRINPTRNVEFTISKNLFVKGDKSLLHVMLRNLIDNAWKFTSTKHKGKIKFGMTSDQDKKVFYIQDNGIGFDMKYSDKIFEAFQRHNSEFEGNGIGLATAKRVVKRHHGELWAEGEVNKGATFYFTLGS